MLPVQPTKQILIFVLVFIPPPVWIVLINDPKLPDSLDRPLLHQTLLSRTDQSGDDLRRPHYTAFGTFFQTKGFDSDFALCLLQRDETVLQLGIERQLCARDGWLKDRYLAERLKVLEADFSNIQPLEVAPLFQKACHIQITL